jgi:hypothetical protein
VWSRAVMREVEVDTEVRESEEGGIYRAWVRARIRTGHQSCMFRWGGVK